MVPKINQAIANQIRQLAKDGVLHKQLAHRFRVSKATISMIVNNRVWKENGKS